jgi:hypothetical protein
VQAATVRETPNRYDVRLPEAGLGWEKIGPLFERYSVALVGSIDTHWAEAYKAVVVATPRLVRFRLDADHAIVSFTCRSTDGPVEVMAVLKILEGLIQRVNSEASLAAVRPPAKAAAGLDETTDPRRVTPGARAHRGGLFARAAGNSK